MEAVWATEEEEEDVVRPVLTIRKMGLSLRLSHAETIEDEHAADIQVEGAEPTTPAFGLKLKLTVASADDDNTPQIATSSNIQSAQHTLDTPQPHRHGVEIIQADARYVTLYICSVTMAPRWRISGS